MPTMLVITVACRWLWNRSEMRLSSPASSAVEVEHVAGKIGDESRCHCLTAHAGVLQAGGVDSCGRDLAGGSDLAAAKPRVEFLDTSRADRGRCLKLADQHHGPWLVKSKALSRERFSVWPLVVDGVVQQKSRRLRATRERL
jgi:hypothetical protein